ncbi:MAG: hypothetical protein J0L84_03095 [Verrucomicrobia bacterium]|nr:hypothetical protein [Verrucomicrobiota bacterium]
MRLPGPRLHGLRLRGALRDVHRTGNGLLVLLLLLGMPWTGSGQNTGPDSPGPGKAAAAGMATGIPVAGSPGGLNGAATGRRTLGSDRVSAELAQLLQQLRSPATPRVRDRSLPDRPHFFLRLSETRYWVSPDGRMRPEARLGGTPFVFLTVAEAGLGRSLFGLYADLGYGAESVLRQRRVPMAAVVFRYPAGVRIPRPWQPPEGPDWRQQVYQPTWDTLMDLFAQLAGDTDAQGAFLEFPDLRPGERNLVRFLPPRPRQQVATLPYELLRLAGGPDWEYRALLETHLSVNPHFRGTGITQNTLSPDDGRLGVPEFVGPNALLTDLAEWAVVDLGHLEFEEIHDPAPR